MKQTPARKMSNAARLWVAADKIWPPFCNQMILEGPGEPDPDSWKQAVAIASEANPGSRLVLKGICGTARWSDTGITPPVREADGGLWEGSGPGNAPFLERRLDPFKGPSCEVVLVRGAPMRVAFRTHHGVMDGRGTQTWAEDIFRALRGEPVIGSDYLAVEEDLLNGCSGTHNGASTRYRAPTGNADRTESGLTWKRTFIPGKFSQLLPSTLSILARECGLQENRGVRIGIPVDLRPRREGFRSTSNLTNAIFIDIQDQSRPEQIAGALKQRLSGREDGIVTWEDRIIRHLPLIIIEKVLKAETDKSFAENRFRYTGFVSNLGRLPLETLSGGGFRAETGFFIPPGMEWMPLFMTLTGNGTGIEMVVTMPRALASNNRLDTLVNAIVRNLNPLEGEP